MDVGVKKVISITTAEGTKVVIYQHYEVNKNQDKEQLNKPLNEYEISTLAKRDLITTRVTLTGYLTLVEVVIAKLNSLQYTEKVYPLMYA